MTTKKVFLIESSTGEFQGAYDAQENPLEPGEFIVPESSTEVEPPPPIAGKTAVFANGAWSMVLDFRGQVWFDKTSGAQVQIDVLGQPSENLVATYTPTPTIAELAALARLKRDTLIQSVSWRYERHAREMRLGIAATEALFLLDTYVQTLADIPAQTGFPQSIIWPIIPA